MERERNSPEQRRLILAEMVQELAPTSAAYVWETFLKQLHNEGHSESELLEILFETINQYISGIKDEPTNPPLIDTDPGKIQLSKRELIEFIGGKLLPINSHLAEYFPKLSFHSQPQSIEELHTAAGIQIDELRSNIAEQIDKLSNYDISTDHKTEFITKLNKLSAQIAKIEETIEATAQDEVIVEQRTALQQIRYEFNSLKYKLKNYENNHRPG
jgi:hypothetical protein